MNKIKDFYQDYLEWEIIDTEETITKLSFENGLYSLSEDCIINFGRDNQYDLRVVISGIAKSRKDLEPNIDKVNGTFFKAEAITGYTYNGLVKYKLFGIALLSSQCKQFSVEEPSIQFTAELKVDRIERYFNQDNLQTEVIQEWYLSGPTKVNFPRHTSRGVDNTFKKVRGGLDGEQENRFLVSSSGGNDFIYVKQNDVSFLVSKVPNDYGPAWSFNLSIEYRQSFGGIPSSENREAVSELISFVFGTHILKIGESSYDSSLNIVSQKFQHPWGDNTVNKCEKTGSPPVNIGNYQDWGRAEILINQLLPEYLSKRKTLALKDSLWKFWIAKSLALGTNLPILSSAVESLCEKILKSHPEKKHYYIEYSIFIELIKDELASIEAKIPDNLDKEKILNKIKGASQRGANEKLELAFEIIELPIDKLERKAIKARNKMAHSSLGEIDDDEIKKTIRLTRAYETLFHRLVLKILGYKDNYIDYYTFGHPDRNIDTPIPE